jgi:hypothetical protein
LNKWTFKGLKEWYYSGGTEMPKEFHVYSTEEWMEHMPGGKKRKYENAFDSVLSPQSKMYCFLKKELLSPKLESDPRIISNRDSKYQVLVSPWVYSYQKALARTWNAENEVCFSSGMSADQLGDWYTACQEEFGQYQNPKIVENDFSRFDSTIQADLLSFEFSIYEQAGCPPEVLELLKKQLFTAGFSPHGHSYSVKGTRKSGDCNTSVGNSLLNGLIALYMARKAGVKKIKLIVVGDDSLIFLDHPDPASIYNTTSYAEFGLKSKTKIHDLNSNEPEYCSGLFYRKKEGGFMFGPKIGRVLFKYGFSTRQKPVALHHKELKGAAIGKIKDVSDLPILSNLYTAVLAKLEHVEARYNDEFRHHIGTHQLWSTDQDGVYDLLTTRYGLTKSDFIDLGKQLDKLELDSFFDDPRFATIIMRDLGVTTEEVYAYQSQIALDVACPNGA